MNQEESRNPCLDCEKHSFYFRYGYCDSKREVVIGRIISCCRNYPHVWSDHQKEVEISCEEYRNCNEGQYLDFTFDEDVCSKSLQECIKNIIFQDCVLEKWDKRCILYVERNLEEWNSKEPENETDKIMRQMPEEAMDGHGE